MSSDYIKIYKNDKQSFFQVDGEFKNDLFIGIDLYVEKSKYLLAEAFKKGTPSAARSTK